MRRSTPRGSSVHVVAVLALALMTVTGREAEAQASVHVGAEGAPFALYYSPAKLRTLLAADPDAFERRLDAVLRGVKQALLDEALLDAQGGAPSEAGGGDDVETIRLGRSFRITYSHAALARAYGSDSGAFESNLDETRLDGFLTELRQAVLLVAESAPGGSATVDLCQERNCRIEKINGIWYGCCDLYCSSDGGYTWEFVEVVCNPI